MSNNGNRTEQGAPDDVAAPREGDPQRPDEAAADQAAVDTLADGEHGADREQGGEGAADVETSAGNTAGRDLAAEVAALQDQLLRKQADFENFRRRLHRDRDEAIRYANTEVLLDLADVIDGLERAIQTGEDADVGSLRDGVSLIEKQLIGLLERKWGFCRFASEGEPFDPERHQAIASEETDTYEVATVVEDYQRGYLLHDRVVRPARVKVAQPLSGSNDDPASARGDVSADTKEGE
jgi:molecular chaperone GrpE